MTQAESKPTAGLEKVVDNLGRISALTRVLALLETGDGIQNGADRDYVIDTIESMAEDAFKRCVEIMKGEGV